MFEFGKNKDKIFCKYLLKYFWEMPRALIRAIHLSSANPGHYHCQENMVAQHEKTQQIQHWQHYSKSLIMTLFDFPNQMLPIYIFWSIMPKTENRAIQEVA